MSMSGVGEQYVEIRDDDFLRLVRFCDMIRMVMRGVSLGSEQGPCDRYVPEHIYFVMCWTSVIMHGVNVDRDQ